MSREIKVSIIMPSYNVGAYIGECIESVVSQTLKDIEIICIDAGSTDETLEILEKFAAKDERIRLLHSDVKSYGYQMNMGLASACGEYIGIVETDDFIAPDMYEELYRLTNCGKIDIVKGSFWFYYSYTDGTPSQKKLHEMPGIPVGEKLSLQNCPELVRGHPSIWSAIYRREFLERNYIRFIEAPGGGWVDNPFLFETMCAAECVVWTDKPYYYYRQTNPNSSSNRQPDLTVPIRRMLDNLDVVEKYRITNRETLIYVYERIWNTIWDVQHRTEYAGQEEQVLPWIKKMLLRLDPEFVRQNFDFSQQYLFYTNISPLRILGANAAGPASDEKISISSSDLQLILAENDFLRSSVEPLRSAALDLESIENGLSYRIGRSLTWPLRKMRALIGR